MRQLCQTVFDENGNLMVRGGSNRYITDRKRAEDAVQEARTELEARVEEWTTELTEASEALRSEILERKQAEEAYRQSEEKYRQLFGTVPDAILVLDGETGQFIDVNEKACSLYCYSRKEFFELRHADTNMELGSSNASTVEGLAGKHTHVVIRQHRRKDGTTFPAEISSSSLALAGRKVLCCVIRDITKRRQAEEAMRQQLNFQQNLIDTIPTPIFYKDTKGRYLGCNSSFESYIGMCKADIIGKTVYEIAPEDLADIYWRADLALIEAPGTQQYETRVRHGDATRRDVFFTKGTFTDLDGKVGGIVGVMLDITELKRTERELSGYRDHLEDLVKERTAELAKSNELLTREINERKRAEEALKMFAYSVAHDLKSPSIGIHGLTKRIHKLYGHALDEKGKTYCDQILKVSKHIATLVEQVNAFIAAKEATPLFEDICIRDILLMLRNEFSARLRMRRIEWIEPEMEVRITADRLCLVRVFRNLIDNALKYGGERLSKIWIGYEQREDLHIFSLADNGKGLKEADSEKVFRLFERSETSRGVEGVGLGLAIVKEIAEQHGGRVWVEPAAKKGTTFCISISKNL